MKPSTRPKARFIKSITEAARQNQAEMPWTRGTHRASFAANRRTDAVLARVKTA